MAESGTWRLNARAPNPEEESDDEQQKKNRRRRRKPLPPIDMMGGGGSGISGNPSVGAPFLSTAGSNSFVPPHASAFSVPKPRHHYVVVDDSIAQSSASSSASNSMLHLSPPSHQTHHPGFSPTGQNHQNGLSATVIKRSASPMMMQSPLSTSSSASRTVTICCCIQVQFEGGNRRCSRTVLWLVLVTSLICVFSVVTVSLSYYSVDFLQPKSSKGSSMFKKLNNAFFFSSSGDDTASKSWISSVNNNARDDGVDVIESLVPSSAIFPETLKRTSEFLIRGNAWAKENLADAPKRIFQPYSVDFLTARALFPDAKSYFVISQWPCPPVESLKKCIEDPECQKRASDFAVRALSDLENEGFVKPETLNELALTSSLGAFPAVVASIRAFGGRIPRVEQSPPEMGLSCLKFTVEVEEDGEQRLLAAVYCGGLNEAIEVQRKAIKSVLKPIQPLTTLVRSANYALHSDVQPGVDKTALAHFKAMIMALSSHIVQDDSGIPVGVLMKHENDVQLFGEYKGLADPKLSGLSKSIVPGTVVKSLYQPQLTSLKSNALLPFRFGYRDVIRPTGAKTPNGEDVFARKGDFGGSHLIVARKKAASTSGASSSSTSTNGVGSEGNKNAPSAETVQTN